MDTIPLQIPAWLMQIINAGLIELPWKTANPAITEINRQIRIHQSTQDGSASNSPAASGIGKP
jgi:hypothetical protein